MSATSVRLSEYNFDKQDSKWKQSGITYIMDSDKANGNNPPPESIDKSVKVEWRHRHSGTSDLERKWWRHRRTEIITMKGKFLDMSFDDDDSYKGRRLAMEAMATRNALWKILIQVDGHDQLLSPKMENEDGDLGSQIISTEGSPQLVGAYTEDRGNNYGPFYIITDSSFGLVPGKRIIEWSLSFERVMNVV